MAKVELKAISKTYDNKVEAVRHADITIDDREFVVLVGPSGCGKSTLLRMVAGLEEITSGNLFIDDRRVNDVPPKDRDIAMVFQNYALYPHMTVFDNMAFGLKLRKFSRKEIKERVGEAADILGIHDLLDRRPKALSGGQRQRVAIGRAIVRKPKAFLFDEPLSNLDAKLRVQMRVEIKKLHARLASTMIYVTHDQVEAMTMGDRIVVLENGAIQQIDTPLNLYNKPANLFVAGFIGSPGMNLIKGRIVRQGKLQFQSEGIQLSLPDALHANLEKVPGDVMMGVRPENMHSVNSTLGRDELSESQGMAVEVVEPVGNEVFVYLRSGERQLCMRTSPDRVYQAQQNIEIGFDLDKLHFFDAEDGERIG